MSNELIPANSILISRGTGYVNQSNGTIIVKLPDVVYQICYEAAGRGPELNLSLEWKQHRIFTIVNEWAQENYPKHGIIGFLDLDRKQANQLSTVFKSMFNWGLYLVLQENTTTIRL